MQGGRKLSSWNMFVKKVYKEGKSKDSSYEFKQALVDASKRKSEMGSMKAVSQKNKPKGKSRRMAMAMAGGKSRRMAMAGGKSRRMAMAGGKSRRMAMA